MTSDERSEDRRVQIQAKLENVKAALRNNEVDVFNREHHASWDDVEWLLDQLSALSTERDAAKALAEAHRQDSELLDTLEAQEGSNLREKIAALSRVQEGLREALEEAREAVIAQDWPAMLTRVDAALDAEKTNARP